MDEYEEECCRKCDDEIKKQVKWCEGHGYICLKHFKDVNSTICYDCRKCSYGPCTTLVRDGADERMGNCIDCSKCGGNFCPKHCLYEDTPDSDGYYYAYSCFNGCRNP